MNLMGNSHQSPTIEYPCEWVYKVIGIDEKQLREAIDRAMGTHPIVITFSRKNGKYTCLNVTLILHTDEERVRFYTNLSQEDSIVRVL